MLFVVAGAGAGPALPAAQAGRGGVGVRQPAGRAAGGRARATRRGGRARGGAARHGAREGGAGGRAGRAERAPRRAAQGERARRGAARGAAAGPARPVQPPQVLPPGPCQQPRGPPRRGGHAHRQEGRAREEVAGNRTSPIFAQPNLTYSHLLT